MPRELRAPAARSARARGSHALLAQRPVDRGAGASEARRRVRAAARSAVASPLLAARGRAATLTTTRSSVELGALAQCRAQLEQLVTACSGVATAPIAVWRGRAASPSIRSPWRAIGPTCAACANVRGALSSAEPVAGRRCVDDDDVVGCAPAVRALRLRQLPDLADGQQLAQPRCRGGDVADVAARADRRRRSRAAAAGRAGTPRAPAAGRPSSVHSPGASSLSTPGSPARRRTAAARRRAR